VIFVVSSLLIYYNIYKARKGKPREIRKIPALTGLEEIVKRAAEMGRPIQVTTGMGEIQGAYGAQTVAGLAVLSHVARMCAENDVRLIVPVIRASNLPATEAAVQLGYEMAGKPEEYAPSKQVVFLSDDQFAWAAGMLGILERERCAGQVLVGLFMAETLLLLEAGVRAGAMQVGGTAFIANIPFFVTSCDYTLITEEIFAASAYLSGDPGQVGSIGGQDMIRLLLLMIMVVGIVAAAMGSGIIYDLLGV
jgi:hypothetical protein